MTVPDDNARLELLARLGESREELRRVLEPQAELNEDGTPNQSEFPRSRTMRLLMSSRGLKAVGAVAAGLLLARPAIALRLLRLVPLGAVARALMIKGLGSLRSRRRAH
jgi:hypothetical protein